jgi:nucleotide-binding universal stress UspA family protein
MKGAIVVGTDGSDTAALAVTEAISLAKAFDKPLHIVAAYKPSQPSGVPAEFADAMTPHSAVESLLAGEIARAKSAGVDAQSHARTGDAADAIIDVAEETEAALIVVGDRGIGRARRFVLGNVPSKVVHHSPCSTYVVHTSR